MRSIRVVLYSLPPWRRCAVHRMKMLRDSLPIARHWVQIHRDYRRDADKEFPNAAAFVVVPAHVSAQFSQVWYCTECRAREKQWCDEHAAIAPNKDYDREPPTWAYEAGASWR